MSTQAQVPDFIPAEQPDFIPSGPTRFEQERAPANREGFLQAAWNTVKGIPGGIVAATSDPQQAAVDTGVRVINNDAHRKEEGRAGAYRAIAGVGDALGIDSRGMEDAADRGDTAGILGHAAGSAAPYLAPMAAEGALRGAGAAARPVGRGILRTANAIDPDIVGLASPRLAHAQRLAIRTGNVLQKLGSKSIQPVPEGTAAEPIAETPEAAHPKPVIQTPEAQPYRLGPGQVVPDVVGTPNGNILAGGKGIIVRPPKLLPEWKPIRAYNATEAIDDAGVNQEMAGDLESHGRSALREESRDFAEKNSADIPKWKRLAQFRAQMAAENVMREAEMAQQIPAQMTKTRVPKAPKTRGDILNPGSEDLTGILEESLKQALAKKGQPKAGK